MLGYLANNGPTLQDFVTLSLIKLVCRITKLGWFDDATHRELTEDVTKFLQATIDHCILGLKILNQLVDELNIPTSGRTLTQHRKTSVSFRDLCLFKVFQLGLTTLKQLQTRAISECGCLGVCRDLADRVNESNSLSQITFFVIVLFFVFLNSRQSPTRSHPRRTSPRPHRPLPELRLHRDQPR